MSRRRSAVPIQAPRVLRAAGPARRKTAAEEAAALFCGKSGGGYWFCRPEVERNEAEAAGRDRL
jgi:hypothetical protein